MTFKSTLLQSRIKTKWTFKSQIESISSCLYARLLNFLITIYTSGSKQPFISLISLLLRLVRHTFISFLLENSIQSPVIPNQPLFYPTYFAIFWTWKHLPTTQKKHTFLATLLNAKTTLSWRVLSVRYLACNPVALLNPLCLCIISNWCVMPFLSFKVLVILNLKDW